MPSSIAIIDYGMGNLHSIRKALQYATEDKVVVTQDPETILQSDRVVFPGVGAMRDCIAQMREQGVIDVTLEAARSKPFLGICIGMQALMTHSDENDGVMCLDLVPGNIRRLPEKLDRKTQAQMKIPHMGWNRVHQTLDHPLWRGIHQDSWFYFVHSYYLPSHEFAYAAGVTDYTDQFVAALSKENVFAVQFHPEKSQKAGLALLKNFTRWEGCETTRLNSEAVEV